MHAVETMAFSGAVPWHGLGHQITNPEDLISGDAFMRAAGLDWTVSKVSLQYGVELPDEDGKTFLDDISYTGDTVPDEYHLVRCKDGKFTQLGEVPVTQYQYKIRQNADMFAVFDPFLASGEMTLNTAGSLFNGRRVWVLAQLTDGFRLAGEDDVNNFLLFTINHSGVDANTAFYTPVRVVCNNTLRLAQSGAGNTVRDNHKTPFNIELMRTAIEMIKDQSIDFEKLAKKMSEYTMTGQESVDFFRTVYNAKPKEDENTGKLIDRPVVSRALGLFRGQETRTKNVHITKDAEIRKLQDTNRKMQETIEAMERGEYVREISEEVADLPDENVNPGWNKKSSEQTVWGALNVVTFMEDHSPQKRSTTEDLQLQRSLYGQKQNDYKVAAINAARKLVAA